MDSKDRTYEQDNESVALKKPMKWFPLEGNPEVWNKIIHANGIDPTWSFTDILGLDPELLSLIPQPTGAIIFLFPITQEYEAFREKEETHLKVLEQNISPHVVYYKQTISNACGMMALLHAIANNSSVIGPGLFQTIVQDTKNMSPLERVEYLENCTALAELHRSSALEGQTQTPDLSEQLRLHFICFVKVDDHLYELDGRRDFPINHGRCPDFIESTVKIMKQFIERNPEEKEYTAMAFSKI